MTKTEQKAITDQVEFAAIDIAQGKVFNALQRLAYIARAAGDEGLALRLEEQRHQSVRAAERGRQPGDPA